jgi:hypothetical protein
MMYLTEREVAGERESKPTSKLEPKPTSKLEPKPVDDSH